MKNYNKNKGKSRCTTKIDIIKAFDSVHRGFVINILKAMGFPPTFDSRINTCITTPIFSVKINGVSEGFFSGKRGLRQGDSLCNLYGNIYKITGYCCKRRSGALSSSVC